MIYRNTLCLLVIMIAIISPCHSQFVKGTRMAGATIGGAFFNSGKYDYSYPSPTNGYTSNTNSLGITLSPEMGWFIKDNLAIGGQLMVGYKYDKRIDAANNVTFSKDIFKSFSQGLNVFARNYFASQASFVPFAQLSAGFGIGSSKNDGFSYHPTYKETYKGKSSEDFSANGGVSLGVTKLLNTHIGLDLYAGYMFNYNKTGFKTTSARDIGIDGTIDETGELDQARKATLHNFVVGVGFQIFLEKRK